MKNNLKSVPNKLTLAIHSTDNSFGFACRNNNDEDHICNVPDFKAKKPFIHVSIVKDKVGYYKTEWDVQSCGSFIEEFGKWAKINPGLELPI